MSTSSDEEERRKQKRRERREKRKEKRRQKKETAVADVVEADGDQEENSADFEAWYREKTGASALEAPAALAMQSSESAPLTMKLVTQYGARSPCTVLLTDTELVVTHGDDGSESRLPTAQITSFRLSRHQTASSEDRLLVKRRRSTDAPRLPSSTILAGASAGELFTALSARVNRHHPPAPSSAEPSVTPAVVAFFVCLFCNLLCGGIALALASKARTDEIAAAQASQSDDVDNARQLSERAAEAKKNSYGCSAAGLVCGLITIILILVYYEE